MQIPEEVWTAIRVFNIFGGAIIGFGLVHLWWSRHKKSDIIKVYTFEIAVILAAVANAWGASETLIKDVPGDTRVLFAFVFTLGGIYAVLRPNRLMSNPYHAPGLKPSLQPPHGTTGGPPHVQGPYGPNT